LDCSSDCIELAGALGVWGDVSDQGPFIGIFLAILSTGQQSQKVLEALNFHVRTSDQSCSDLISSPTFSRLFSDIEPSPAFFQLIGSVMSREITPPEIWTRTLQYLLRNFENNDADEATTSICLAISDGCYHGSEYVDLCLPLVPLFVQSVYREGSFRMKSAVVQCLCNLFLAASCEAALRFPESGFFAVIAEFGNEMTGGNPLAIGGVLREIFACSLSHGNQEWRDFLRSPEVLEILEILVESADTDLAAVAIQILNSDVE
jgi:hypothetical protein